MNRNLSKLKYSITSKFLNNIENIIYLSITDTMTMKICLEDYSKLDQLRYLRVKNMSQTELSAIKPLWTDTTTKNKIYSSGIYFGLEDKTTSIITVDIKKLILKSDFISLNPESLISDDINDFRFVEIIERWEQSLFIDPPEISFQQNTKNYIFTDGRHRTISAYQIGVHSIPVAVYTQQLDDFEGVLFTNSK